MQESTSLPEGTVTYDLTAIAPSSPIAEWGLTPDLNCLIRQRGAETWSAYAATACAPLIEVDGTRRCSCLR
ncbi:MAG: hypothetical protein SPI77_02065 [Corynebacterium sp.]|nr:hypothetical protein [Corynebacterium sp.]